MTHKDAVWRKEVPFKQLSTNVVEIQRVDTWQDIQVEGEMVAGDTELCYLLYVAYWNTMAQDKNISKSWYGEIRSSTSLMAEKTTGIQLQIQSYRWRIATKNRNDQAGKYPETRATALTRTLTRRKAICETSTILLPTAIAYWHM